MATVNISHSIINNLILDVTDGKDLLWAYNSKILDSSIQWRNDQYGSSTLISDSIMHLYQSELIVRNCKVYDLSTEYPLIFSNCNSKSFFEYLDKNNIQIAVPEWTPYAATSPTYGNGLSCNIIGSGIGAVDIITLSMEETTEAHLPDSPGEDP